jgi:hypothetical protein
LGRGEGVLVEGVVGLSAPDVVYGHGVVFGGEVALGALFGRIDEIIWLNTRSVSCLEWEICG